jgi:hypothetical protein
MTWRKKWKRDWDRVRTCSAACRRRGVGRVDRELERALLGLLEERARGATVCPSEAARAVAGPDPEAWRPLMERTRSAARRLEARDRVVILQRGRPVDPSRTRGPIRVGRA